MISRRRHRLHHYLGNWYLLGDMFRHPEQQGESTPPLLKKNLLVLMNE